MGNSLRGKLDTTPKPRFLAIIEDYLYNELKALGVDNATGSEVRLQVRVDGGTMEDRSEPSLFRSQVFREVFSAVIDDFKTYKPLLSSIKNEYEIMIAYYKDKIKELEPLTVRERDERDASSMEFAVFLATTGAAERRM